MTKKVNFGLDETIKGSHRTLSDAVNMYAIYYSDWTTALEELSKYYDSEEWISAGYGIDLPQHVELTKRRNHALASIKEIGAELRAIGVEVDLCEWADHEDLGGIL